MFKVIKNIFIIILVCSAAQAYASVYCFGAAGGDDSEACLIINNQSGDNLLMKVVLPQDASPCVDHPERFNTGAYQLLTKPSAGGISWARFLGYNSDCASAAGYATVTLPIYDIANNPVATLEAKLMQNWLATQDEYFKVITQANAHYIFTSSYDFNDDDGALMTVTITKK